MWSNEDAYNEIIAAHAPRFGVPVWVVKATIAKESGFRPDAFRGEPQISDASRGLMQLLERTARGLGYKGLTGDDATHTGGLYEPEINIHLGIALLAQLKGRYPVAPWDEIYAAYNAGSIRKDAAGQLLNEAHVKGWRHAATYFQAKEGIAPPKASCPLCTSGQAPPKPRAGRAYS